MGKLAIVLAGTVALAGLAGCENVSKRHFTVGSVSDDYRSRHPIVISEKEQTMDIPVATGSKGLPGPGSQRSLWICPTVQKVCQRVD